MIARCLFESYISTIFPHIRPAGTICSFHFYSKVTVHKCAGIVRTRVLFKGGLSQTCKIVIGNIKKNVFEKHSPKSPSSFELENL